MTNNIQFVNVKNKRIPINPPHIDIMEMDIISLLEIEGLDSINAPIYLNVRGNSIESLEDCSDFPYINHLILSGNKLKSLKGIEHFPNLRRLNVMGNYLTKISHLESCPHLEHLSLAHNKITKIEGLTNLPALRSLGLNNNQIHTVEGLGNLHKLERLNVSGNPIDPDLIEQLGGTDANGFMKDSKMVYNYCNKDEGPWLL